MYIITKFIDVQSIHGTLYMECELLTFHALWLKLVQAINRMIFKNNTFSEPLKYSQNLKYPPI